MRHAVDAAERLGGPKAIEANDNDVSSELAHAASLEKSMTWYCMILAKHLRIGILVFGFVFPLILAACDDKPATTGPQGPPGPAGPQGPPGPRSTQVMRVIAAKAKADCNPDEVMISAYCSVSGMKPNGTGGASCVYEKADIVVTCLKR
jgi:hypothetical protein